MAEFHLVGKHMVATFTLPREDWSAIDTRIAAALSLEPIADTVVHTLPNYRELLEVCKSWQSDTWPSMIAQAQAIADLSSVTMTSYQLLDDYIKKLDDYIKKLDDSRPLTDDEKDHVHKIINPLSAAFSSRQSALEDVDDALVHFSNVNQNTDARLQSIKGALGPEWTMIGTETSAIDQAVGAMRGDWGAVVDDFQALSDGKLEMTTAFLLDLSLESAILGWQNLGQEAQAFAAQGNPPETLMMPRTSFRAAAHSTRIGV